MKINVVTKTFVLLSFMIFFSAALFSQIKFEKGYFISKDGLRTECFIWNTDSRNNPHSFSYKLTEAEKPNTLNADDVREVGILGYSKYISASVKIDRSVDDPTDMDELSLTREPKWSSEDLFLKVIVDGQSALLYSYYERGFVRFFYSENGSSIEQLVYKPYKTGETAYEVNRDYLNQLNASVKCDPSQKVIQPEYRESDLKKYFNSYNICKGSPVTHAVNHLKTKRFSVSILAGMEHASLRSEYYLMGSITHFDSKTSPFEGVELEYTMPFDRNKYSFLLDIYNDNYSSMGKDSLGAAKITYGTITSVIGPRYRTFINNNSSIFISAMAVLEFRRKTSYEWHATPVSYYYDGYSLDIKTYAPVVAFGVGYAYKKISVEARYLTTKEIFPSDPSVGSNFKRMALMVKYRLFKF